MATSPAPLPISVHASRDPGTPEKILRLRLDQRSLPGEAS
jgi:hypothetical protein